MLLPEPLKCSAQSSVIKILRTLENVWRKEHTHAHICWEIGIYGEFSIFALKMSVYNKGGSVFGFQFHWARSQEEVTKSNMQKRATTSSIHCRPSKVSRTCSIPVLHWFLGSHTNTVNSGRKGKPETCWNPINHFCVHCVLFAAFFFSWAYSLSLAVDQSRPDFRVKRERFLRVNFRPQVGTSRMPGYNCLTMHWWKRSTMIVQLK